MCPDCHKPYFTFNIYENWVRNLTSIVPWCDCEVLRARVKNTSSLMSTWDNEFMGDVDIIEPPIFPNDN